MPDESVAALARAAADGDLPAARRLVSELERASSEEPRYWLLSDQPLGPEPIKATATGSPSRGCGCATCSKPVAVNVWATPLRSIGDVARALADAPLTMLGQRVGRPLFFDSAAGTTRVLDGFHGRGYDGFPVALEPGWTGLCPCGASATLPDPSSRAKAPPERCAACADKGPEAEMRCERRPTRREFRYEVVHDLLETRVPVQPGPAPDQDGEDDTSSICTS